MGSSYSGPGRSRDSLAGYAPSWAPQLGHVRYGGIGHTGQPLSRPKDLFDLVVRRPRRGCVPVGPGKRLQTDTDLRMNGAQSDTRSGREDRIMAMALTRDEQRVLQHLASGRSIDEIAATLNWPLQAVRWTCTHPLLAWVLDQLEASATPSDSPEASRQVSQGRSIVDYIARRWTRRATRASGAP